MCIVHRIFTDAETGLKDAIRFEFPPKKGITLSTREITSGAFSLGVTALEANTSTAITISRKHAKQERRESFTERARRLETARLTGASIKMRPPEEHELSPQMSAEHQPIRKLEIPKRMPYCIKGKKFFPETRGWKDPDSHGNRGRKPEHKNKNRLPVIW